MNKGFFKVLMTASFVTCGLGFMLPGDSFGMYRNMNQEEADKEFGKMRAQGHNLTINTPLPVVKQATDEEYQKWLKTPIPYASSNQRNYHQQSNQGSHQYSHSPYQGNYSQQPVAPTVGGLWSDLNNPGNYRSRHLSKEQREYNSRTNPSGSPEYNPGGHTW